MRGLLVILSVIFFSCGAYAAEAPKKEFTGTYDEPIDGTAGNVIHYLDFDLVCKGQDPKTKNDVFQVVEPGKTSSDLELKQEADSAKSFIVKEMAFTIVPVLQQDSTVPYRPFIVYEGDIDTVRLKSSSNHSVELMN